MSPINERTGTIHRATSRAMTGQNTMTPNPVTELRLRNSRQEQPDQLLIDEELPSYESVQFLGPPAYSPRAPTPPSDSPTRAPSPKGLLGKLRSLLGSHQDRRKTQDIKRQHIRHLIEHVEIELGLLRDVQSTTARAKEMDATLKLDRERCSPAEMSQRLNERKRLDRELNVTYRQLNDLANVRTFTSEWLYQATPRIRILEAKLRHLNDLDKAQQHLLHIEKSIDRVQLNITCPKYSRMSKPTACGILDKLHQGRSMILQRMVRIEKDIAGFDRALQSLLTQYSS